MCNPQNIDIIISRFLVALSNTYDQFQRQLLVDKICDLAERLAPEPSWYINTMTQVFAFGGRQVKPAMEANLIRLLSDSQGDPVMDKELRCLAVKQLYPLVSDPLAPESLIRVSTWIFGEFGHLSSDPTLGQIVDLLGDIWKRPALSTETKSYLISAFMKISAQTQTIPNIASVIVRECMKSHHTELVQQAIEFREMCKSGAGVFLAAIPNKHEAGLTIDSDLHFLDSYVMQGRLSGMKDYVAPEDSDEDEGDGGLKTDAYEAPETMVAQATAPPKDELKKEDGFIDFSAVSGTFGFKPVVAESPKPQPSVADMFGGMESSQNADMFSGMESSQSADMFGGMESNTMEPSAENEVKDQREMQAAALFSGVASSKPAPMKVVKKEDKKLPLQPANPLFAGVSNTGFFQPAQPAQPAQPSQPAQPVQNTEPTQAAMDMFSGMSAPSLPAQPAPVSPVSPAVDMMDFNMTATTTVNEEIDMTHCKLSPTYKIFTKDPSSELVLLPHDNTVFLATNMIYRVTSIEIGSSIGW